MPASPERSVQACPVCGAHQLALIDFPEISTVGYQPYNEVIGMGEAQERNEPGIGCLACGAGWSSLRAFKQGAAAATMAGETPATEPVGADVGASGTDDTETVAGGARVDAGEPTDREPGHPG
jgi:hypothetical protein